MKKNTTLKSLLVGATLLCSGFYAQAASVSSYIYLGTAPDNESVCTGRGVCKGGNGISVTFSTEALAATSTNTPAFTNSITMTFSLAQLQLVQPEQVQYFTTYAADFHFDKPYALNNEMLAGLNLPSNSWILTSSPATVSVNGDVVTVTLSYVSGN